MEEEKASASNRTTRRVNIEHPTSNIECSIEEVAP
jgi:hypothetical protein